MQLILAKGRPLIKKEGIKRPIRINLVFVSFRVGLSEIDQITGHLGKRKIIYLTDLSVNEWWYREHWGKKSSNVDLCP